MIYSYFCSTTYKLPNIVTHSQSASYSHWTTTTIITVISVEKSEFILKYRTHNWIQASTLQLLTKNVHTRVPYEALYLRLCTPNCTLSSMHSRNFLSPTTSFPCTGPSLRNRRRCRSQNSVLAFFLNSVWLGCGDDCEGVLACGLFLIVFSFAFFKYSYVS
jgi:hypothetical protein